MDLHIHDVDMIRFLFGEPKSVSAVAVDHITRWQYISSRFFYDGFVAEATGSWLEPKGMSFRAGYRVCFENATVILDTDGITVHKTDGESYKAEYTPANRMAEEIRLLATTIAEPDTVNAVNTPESAASTVALVEALRKSADNGGIIIDL